MATEASLSISSHLHHHQFNHSLSLSLSLSLSASHSPSSSSPSLQNPLRTGRFLTNDELEKLELLGNYSCHQQLESGLLWVRLKMKALYSSEPILSPIPSLKIKTGIRTSKISLQFPLASTKHCCSIKVVLDSFSIDDLSAIRNPAISTSYRNPKFRQPNQTVLDAQTKVCTGPTQTKPLNAEQAFKVLDTILKSGKMEKRILSWQDFIPKSSPAIAGFHPRSMKTRDRMCVDLNSFGFLTNPPRTPPKSTLNSPKLHQNHVEFNSMEFNSMEFNYIKIHHIANPIHPPKKVVRLIHLC